jgi:NAD kinase
MKVALVSYKKELLTEPLARYGLVLDQKAPDAVIAFGGDGTLLFAEQKYPAVPKLFIKHPTDCTNCYAHDFSRILETLAAGRYRIQEEMKLQAIVGKKKVIALNDLSVHYTPPRALRFTVEINGKQLDETIISDGVVVSTPWGSPGYFSSITRRVFRRGLGLAINNPVKPMRPEFLDEHAIIRVRIVRENGVLVWDCSDKPIKLKPGDDVLIKSSLERARLIMLEGMPLKITKY